MPIATRMVLAVCLTLAVTGASAQPKEREGAPDSSSGGGAIGAPTPDPHTSGAKDKEGGGPGGAKDRDKGAAGSDRH